MTSSGQAAQIESVEAFAIACGRRTDIEPHDGAQGESVFYGIAYSRDGRHAWASGGDQGVVHAYDVVAGGSLAHPEPPQCSSLKQHATAGNTPRVDGRGRLFESVRGLSHTPDRKANCRFGGRP